VALGVLLLRFLFWNDTKQAAGISRPLVEDVLASFVPPRSPGGRAERFAGARWDDLAGAFAAKGIDLSPSAVLFRGEDRVPVTAGVPLFKEAVVLALRMGSNIGGFSLCERLDDFPEGRPEAPLEEAIGELEHLIERTRASLVGSGGRNVLVLQACADFRADMEEAAAVLSLQREPGTDGTILARPRGRRPEQKRQPLSPAATPARKDSSETNG
jgi:hypothetical protein